MKNLARCLTVAMLLILPLSAGQAGAGVRFNVDVLWNPNPDDSSQVFLHVTNEAYPMPRERVVAIFHEIPDPYEDYPVLAFMAHHAHVDISTVWAYRKKGHSWVNVMFRFGVPPSALFVELPRPPGPPYGKAYGHWKKHGNRMGRDELTPDDIRYWVKMRTVASYSGVPPRQVYNWRESGQKYDAIAVRQYHQKRGRGNAPARIEREDGGPGKGWGKGHGKPDDKGRDKH